MKKLTLLAVLLLVFGMTFGFAEDVKATYAITGSGTVVWGIDLLTMKHGFNNSYASTLTVTLVPATSVTKPDKAPEGAYGKIALAGFTISVASSAATFTQPGITAQIILAPLTFGIYSAPSLTYTYAGFVPLFAASAGYATTGSVTPLSTTKGGISIGYELAGIGTVTLKAASIGDWGATAAGTAGTATYATYIATGTETVAADTYFDADTGLAEAAGTKLIANAVYVKKTAGAAAAAGSANDQYSVGADFALTAVTGLTVNAGGFYDMLTKKAGFGAKLAYSGSGVTASVGADGTFDTVATADALAYDAAVSLGYAFMEAKDSIALNLFTDNLAKKTRLDVGLLFTDAGGFVPGLAFSLGAYAYDLAAATANNPMWVAVGESGSYKYMLDAANYITPYEKVYYDLKDSQVYFNVGVNIALFPNTVFTVDYAGGTIGNDNNYNLITLGADKSSLLKITTTITY